MSNYWAKRQLEAAKRIRAKSQKETEKQLAKYYRDTMKQVIEDFEATYDKLLARIKDDKDPTPADLYALDRYWQLQAQLKEAAQKLGDKQVELLSKKFEEQWLLTYQGISLPSADAFSTISTGAAKAAIQSVWCADGKDFSQRIWKNVDNLVETLNEKLIDCVVTGRSTSELKSVLKERFGVSNNRAIALVDTEMAHIQVAAAAQRYQDYGLTHYEYFADNDDKTCKHNGHSKSCEELDGKIFRFDEMQVGVNAPPMHPRCRCDILPIRNKVNNEREAKMNECKNCGTPTKNGDFCEACAKKAMEWKNATWWRKRGVPEKEIVEYYYSAGEVDRLSDDYFEYAYNKYLEENPWEKEDILKEIRQKEMRGIFGTETSGFQICEDCGKAYKTFGRNNNSKRCPECQAIYRKKYKAQKERERRAKKKKNK